MAKSKKEMTDDQRKFLEASLGPDTNPKAEDLTSGERYGNAVGQAAVELAGDLSWLGNLLFPTQRDELSPETWGADPNAESREMQDLENGPTIPSENNVVERFKQSHPIGEDFGPNILKKGIGILPWLGGGAPQKAGARLIDIGKSYLRSLPRHAGKASIGAGSSELVRAGGGGEVAQTLGEIAGTSLPNLGKTILKKGGGRIHEKLSQMFPDLLPEHYTAQAARNEKELLRYGRGLGLNEEALALMTENPSTFKQIAGDIAHKGASVKRTFRQGSNALSEVWKDFRDRPEMSSAISAKDTHNLRHGIDSIVAKFPKEQRNLIRDELQTLFKGPTKIDDVITFWQHLNYKMGKHTSDRAIGTLKGPLMNALERTSPGLAKDFRLTNDLSRRFATNSSRMSPNLAQALMQYNEASDLIYGVVTGNYPTLQKWLGRIGGRTVAAKMITNPRMQNLGSRIIDGIEKGSGNTVRQFVNKLIIEMGKVDPEAAEKLSGFDVEDFMQQASKHNANLKGGQ